jgi:uroporphyrin-III C-methyltransferase
MVNVISFTATLLLLSSVGAFLTGSSNCRRITSTSSLHAFMDETYPRAPKGTTTSTTTKTPTTPNNKIYNKEAAKQIPKSKPSKTLPNGGRITLVGAGPGDPNLLTVAAYKILTDPSNLIIVDRLVSKEILELIEGEYKVANKVPGCQGVAQDEIFEWCFEGLRAGKHVVRLKIGDPFVFGRGGEEVLHFREFGVEPSVIPGVSAAFSAPLLGSIPVTHRGISNQVVMCTGYGKDNTSPDLIQYHKEQTVVFLMAVGRLRTLCENLVEKAKYPIDTPVGIVERAGCPDQRTVVGTIETIADLAEEFDVRPPSTIVVGEVVTVLLTEEDFGREVDCVRQQGLVQKVAQE